MIDEAGLRFGDLEPQSLDMPLGFKTGAGVIFGATGGVTEAVLRYAVEKLKGVRLDACDFQEVRGEAGIRETIVAVGDVELKLAVVHGLKNASTLVERIRKGQCRVRPGRSDVLSRRVHRRRRTAGNPRRRRQAAPRQGAV